MKILLVYPEFPDTFWSFKHALRFTFKKASSPPLGLLTVAAMLPDEWDKKLIDMNVSKLTDKDLRWADLVFISGMTIQKESAINVISRCKAIGVKIVAGGPLFTTGHKEFKDVDHFVLNEAEITLPLFLEDLRNGCARHVYTTALWADIEKTPLPIWRLADMKKYASFNIQYSRGCPFQCEFCDITLLCGRVPRTKNKIQILRELDSLYELGWRGSIFFVDDNFIGNKNKLKNEILPAIAEWMERKKHPFSFHTQASIELSDDEELMRLMINAGFDAVFIGIETPNEMSLAECSKVQNKNRDLLSCVKKIQKFGFQVQGGFIVGFDNDPPSIFDAQIKFIQNSGIVTAMVGILNALPKTKLYQRLEKEKRLLKDSTGNNTDFSINFIPKMNYDMLISGYKKILSTVYSPKFYYERVKIFLKEYVHPPKSIARLSLSNLYAFCKSIFVLGVIGKERFHYWRLVFWTMFRRPRLFPLAVTYAIYGFHFRKIYERYQ